MNEEVLKTISEILIKNKNIFDISNRQKHILKDFLEINDSDDDSDNDFEKNKKLLKLKIDIRSKFDFSKHNDGLEYRLSEINGINSIRKFDTDRNYYGTPYSDTSKDKWNYEFTVNLELYVMDDSDINEIKQEIVEEILRIPRMEMAYCQWASVISDNTFVYIDDMKFIPNSFN